MIDPAPFVVELDEHPMGSRLQALLGEKTGRKTVPNVLINGQSIGGGDDIAELDTTDTLIKKVKSMTGKKLLDVRLRPTEDHDHDHDHGL
jgi:glutaredoxin